MQNRGRPGFLCWQPHGGIVFEVRLTPQTFIGKQWMSAPEHPKLRTLGQGAIPQHLFRALRSPPVSARHCLSVGPPPKCGVRVAQLCLTLCDPWTIQSVEFSRPEYWSGEPFPSPGDLPNPGIEPRSPAWQADSLPAGPQGKPSISVNSKKWHSESPLQGFPWY